ncbi:hypothetical protein KFE94_17850 [bacterium SCSIO 12643]|nr:hypothetical protein KFE94_17850 [bacterium SCSIO 12643]
MKYWYYILFLTGLISCNSSTNKLIGKWQVESPFYKAVYQIIKKDGELKTQILFYDDDIYRYRFNGKKEKYLFQNIQQKDEDFVDMVSGATTSANSNKLPKLKLVHEDTLNVTTYQMRKPITETWVRINQNQSEDYE